MKQGPWENHQKRKGKNPDNMSYFFRDSFIANLPPVMKAGSH
jgi:hypothetical protein